LGVQLAALLTALIILATPLPYYDGAHIGYDYMVTVIARVSVNAFSASAVEALGGEVVYLAELAPIAVIRVPASALEKLDALPGVESYSLDGPVYAMPINAELAPPSKQPPQTLPWGVDRIDAELVWSITTGFVDVDGDGDSEIEVAVIDTGVDTDHPDLAGNIKWGIAVQNGRITGDFEDRNGHGTHVAGIIAAINNDIGVVGVAPEVELYIVKALNNGGLGSWSDLIIAIDLAVKGPDGVIDSDGDGVVVGDPDDDAPEVINMSLGGSSPPPELHDIIKAAYNLGVVLVAAAGNEGAPSPSYPAAYPEVIAVGATDENDSVPSWSNRNPEIAAPGVDILSTYLRGGYETLSGTSMASPHVAGVVALIQAARLANGLDPLPPGSETDTGTPTVRAVLHDTAEDLGSSGYDELYGYGLVDAYAAVNEALNR
jgi:subtilisin family serine protease